MSKVLTINGHNIEVTKKNIKNMYLRVRSSEGRIAISAPKHISDDSIRLFILSKLNWITQISEKLQQQAYLTPQKYIDDETYYIWGKQYSLSLVEMNVPASIELIRDKIHLSVRPGATIDTKKQLFGAWSREQLRIHAYPLIEKWCPILSVSINKLYARKMKSCWGSCNTRAHTIRLNTELVKKPLACLEYVVVHELVHLLEPSHNKNFHLLISRFLPDWKERKQLLNRFD
jgi:predicted metal-dependent hydrolase